MITYDVIIVGGGPAGLMAANVLENNKINYLLLEKNKSVGNKLLLTGGKRCNVTNNQSIDQFIDHLSVVNKRFIYPSLMTFGPNDVIDFFKKKGLLLKLENQFKYFPETGKSQSVLDALLKDINSRHILTRAHVLKITKENSSFLIETPNQRFNSKHLIIAVGSNSFPITGSSGDGLLFAKDFDLKTSPYGPAETHIYSNHVKTHLSDLQGLSLSQIDIEITGTNKRITDDLIFTHFGLSGPGIMHLSEDIYASLQTKKTTLTLNLMPITINQFDLLLKAAVKEKMHLIKFIDNFIPKRLSRTIIKLMSVENKPLGHLQKKELDQLKGYLFHMVIPIDRVEDKEKAYVNTGGIHLSELDPKTLMVKKISNLYFIGEAIHIHGPIGGYNITMALSMGYCCAQGIVKKRK